MKVRCIDVGCNGFFITLGMTYEVVGIGENNLTYRIINDHGRAYNASKGFFEVVKEEVTEKVEEEVAEEPQFNWEEFINTKTVVNCDTEDKAKNFLKECRSRGIVWPDNKTGIITRTSWDWYKKETCYGFNFSGNNSLTYADKFFYKNNGYKIIKWESEDMKFKVGDKVVKACGIEWADGSAYKTITKRVWSVEEKYYELDDKKSSRWYDKELKLYEEPQTEFTLAEVIGRNIPGLYVNCNFPSARLKKVEIQKSGRIVFYGTIMDNFGVKSDVKFKLQEPKKQVTIYEIEHKQEGKKYYFRSSQLLQEDNFVVCDTTQGKSYGRVVGGKMLELTENETKSYKECWRA